MNAAAWVRPYSGKPMVRDPEPGDRILALGENNRKLGRADGIVPMRTVYLEEYATCPDDCPFKLNRDCYGNNSRADRFNVTQFWFEQVEREITRMGWDHNM